MKEKIVLALGGNALQGPGADTFNQQLQIMEETCRHILEFLVDGFDVVITHGNGPQVGRIMLQNEISRDETPAMPMDVCGAMSQGMIGYGLQRVMKKILSQANVSREVATVVTQVVVDPEDPDFLDPSKPVGKYYNAEEGKSLIQERGYIIKKDGERGYRRVVPSPRPNSIVELDVVKTLMENGVIVITVGGGGIPVIENDDGSLEGIEAVIDKDLASERLAQDLGAQILMILTQEDHVYLNFARENQQPLTRLGVQELKKYRDDGHFSPGSMLPKIEAALSFVESAPGRQAIITSLGQAGDALKGKVGTIITAEGVS